MYLSDRSNDISDAVLRVSPPGVARVVGGVDEIIMRAQSEAVCTSL